jgi:hypothetical protein
VDPLEPEQRHVRRRDPQVVEARERGVGRVGPDVGRDQRAAGAVAGVGPGEVCDARHRRHALGDPLHRGRESVDAEVQHPRDLT